MKRSRKSPVDKRRADIAKQIETLKSPKTLKTRKDFKSEERYEQWADAREKKLFELDEELTMLDRPEVYNEMPIALAALELGITLDEMVQIIDEGLAEPSFEGEYRAGKRITRDELARLIDIGPDEILRVANKSAEETFTEAVEFVRSNDLKGVRICLERLERLGYVDPYWAVLLTMENILRRDYENAFSELPIDLEFYDMRSLTRDISGVDALRTIMQAFEPDDHLGRVVKERLLAIANGTKITPFKDTFSTHPTEFPSKMNESQRKAMFYSTVIAHALQRHRFYKYLYRNRRDEIKEEELEQVDQKCSLYRA